MSKKGVITVSIFMYVFKYIIVVLPFIIGLVINIHFKDAFNIYVLFTVILIYSLVSLISQWFFIKK
jgi:hypothetical protein